MNDLSQPNRLETLQAQIQQMIDNGQHHIHPARFLYIESLAERSTRHNDKTQTLIYKKISAALEHYQQQCRTLIETAEHLDHDQQATTDNNPAADQETDEANRIDAHAVTRRNVRQQLAQRSDTENRKAFKALIEQLLGEDTETVTDNPSLTQLLQQQEAQAARQLFGNAAHRSANAELKSIGAFRETWNRQHADQLVDTSVNQGPKDAGPLNPERLAIRSLSAVRNISPHYLKRFVSYIETLMWLQQLESQTNSSRKKSAAKKAGRG